MGNEPTSGWYKWKVQDVVTPGASKGSGSTTNTLDATAAEDFAAWREHLNKSLELARIGHEKGHNTRGMHHLGYEGSNTTRKAERGPLGGQTANKKSQRSRSGPILR